MTKYELSISADYVPTWGVVEAIRELFQNALDEETKDASNKMFFERNNDVLLIGNINSTLDIRSLLIGETTKHDGKYIGQHGEGYKIAMMVLLRTGHNITFYNLTKNEIWTTKLVKSRKYGGALVPTVFVEKASIWKHDLKRKLVIEVTNVTDEEYDLIKESNLCIKGLPEHKDTKYGKVLTDPEYKGRIYVSGLYVCTNKQVHYGYDFVPNIIKLDRDRHLVDTFNLCWNASKLLVATDDVKFIRDAMKYNDAEYVHYADNNSALKDDVCAGFKLKHGDNAVPVSTNEAFNVAIASGFRAIMVSEAEQSLIKGSSLYSDPAPVTKTLLERIEEWYEKLCASACDEVVVDFEPLLDELREVL